MYIKMASITQLQQDTINFLRGSHKAEEIWYPELDTESNIILEDLIELNLHDFITFESQPASRKDYGIYPRKSYLIW